MRTFMSFIDHKIKTNPVSEDVGVIRVKANIFAQNHHSTFSTESYVREFIDNDECKSKQDLDDFLSEAEIIDGDDSFYALMNLVDYVVDIDEVTCPGYSLDVCLDLYEEDNLDDDYDGAEMEETVQASFDETSTVRFRPASKHVVESLTRKIYDKKIDEPISLEGCTICLEQFSDGKRLVTLPCGHDYDDECIVTWLKTSHVCPMCRFALPCEED